MTRRLLPAAVLSLLSRLRALAGSRLAPRCRRGPRTADHRCYPPGRYCPPEACAGAVCAPPCVLWFGSYRRGCWCTGVVTAHGGETGYYACCDCLCPDGSGGGFTCGCRRWHRLG